MYEPGSLFIPADTLTDSYVRLLSTIAYCTYLHQMAAPR